MLTAIRCEGALLIRGSTGEEMVGNARDHCVAAHPQLAAVIDEGQIRATVRKAPFLLRADGLDPSQRWFARCPFNDLELLVIYGWKP